MKSHNKGVYLVSSKFKDVPLVEFMYLVFTRMLVFVVLFVLCLWRANYLPWVLVK